MDKNEIAAAITANWAITEASTILQSDVKEFEDNAPQFGMLKEKAGRKIYAFVRSGEKVIIRKLVMPIESDVLRGKEVIEAIERDFTIKPLRRKKK